LATGAAGPKGPTLPPWFTGTPTPNPGSILFRNLRRRSGTFDYSKLLATLPDAPEVRQEIFINNYALIREVFAVPLPGSAPFGTAKYKWASAAFGETGLCDDLPDPSECELVYYVAEMSSLPGPVRDGWLSGLSQVSRNLIQRRDDQGVCCPTQRFLGFDQRNVNQGLLVARGPAAFEVVAGAFDPGATKRAVEGCNACPPPVVSQYGQASLYRWGDGNVNGRRLFQPPAFDWLGRGSVLWVQSGSVVRTLDISRMQQVVDTTEGRARRVADLDDFQLLAQAMSELGAFYMLLSDVPQSLADFKNGASRNLSGDQRTLTLRLLEAWPLLVSYRALATGLGWDENGFYLALALVHEDDADTLDNRDLFRDRLLQAYSFTTGQPWKQDIVRVDDGVQGRVYMAKLYGLAIAKRWVDWRERGDPLVLHE